MDSVELKGANSKVLANSSVQIVNPVMTRRRPPKESFCEFDIIDNYQKEKRRKQRERESKDANDIVEKIKGLAARNVEIEEMYLNSNQCSESSTLLRSIEFSLPQISKEELDYNIGEKKHKSRRSTGDCSNHRAEHRSRTVIRKQSSEFQCKSNKELSDEISKITAIKGNVEKELYRRRSRTTTGCPNRKCNKTPPREPKEIKGKHNEAIKGSYHELQTEGIVQHLKETVCQNCSGHIKHPYNQESNDTDVTSMSKNTRKTKKKSKCHDNNKTKPIFESTVDSIVSDDVSKTFVTEKIETVYENLNGTDQSESIVSKNMNEYIKKAKAKKIKSEKLSKNGGDNKSDAKKRSCIAGPKEMITEENESPEITLNKEKQSKPCSTDVAKSTMDRNDNGNVHVNVFHNKVSVIDQNFAPKLHVTVHPIDKLKPPFLNQVPKAKQNNSFRNLIELYKTQYEKGVADCKHQKRSSRSKRKCSSLRAYTDNGIKQTQEDIKMNRTELSFSNLNLTPLRGQYTCLEHAKSATTQTSVQQSNLLSTTSIPKDIPSTTKLGIDKSVTTVQPPLRLENLQQYSQTTLALRDIYEVAALEKVNSASRYNFKTKRNSTRIDNSAEFSNMVTKQELADLKNKHKHITRNNKFHTSKTVVPNERIVEISSKILKDQKVSFTVEGVEPAKRLLINNRFNRVMQDHLNLCTQIFPGIEINLSDVRLMNHGKYKSVIQADKTSNDSLEIPTNLQSLLNIKKVYKMNDFHDKHFYTSPRYKKGYNLHNIRKDVTKKRSRKIDAKLEMFHKHSLIIQNSRELQKYEVTDSSTQTSNKELSPHRNANIDKRKARNIDTVFINRNMVGTNDVGSKSNQEIDHFSLNNTNPSGDCTYCSAKSTRKETSANFCCSDCKFLNCPMSSFNSDKIGYNPSTINVKVTSNSKSENNILLQGSRQDCQRERITRKTSTNIRPAGRTILCECFQNNCTPFSSNKSKIKPSTSGPTTSISAIYITNSVKKKLSKSSPVKQSLNDFKVANSAENRTSRGTLKEENVQEQNLCNSDRNLIGSEDKDRTVKCHRKEIVALEKCLNEILSKLYNGETKCDNNEIQEIKITNGVEASKKIHAKIISSKCVSARKVYKRRRNKCSGRKMSHKKRSNSTRSCDSNHFPLVSSNVTTKTASKLLIKKKNDTRLLSTSKNNDAISIISRRSIASMQSVFKNHKGFISSGTSISSKTSGLTTSYPRSTPSLLLGFAMLRESSTSIELNKPSSTSDRKCRRYNSFKTIYKKKTKVLTSMKKLVKSKKSSLDYFRDKEVSKLVILSVSSYTLFNNCSESGNTETKVLLVDDEVKQSSNHEMPPDNGIISKEPFFINHNDDAKSNRNIDTNCKTSQDSLEKLHFDSEALCPLTAIFNFTPPSYAYHVYNTFTSTNNKSDDDKSKNKVSTKVEEFVNSTSNEDARKTFTTWANNSDLNKNRTTFATTSKQISRVPSDNFKATLSPKLIDQKFSRKHFKTDDTSNKFCTFFKQAKMSPNCSKINVSYVDNNSILEDPQNTDDINIILPLKETNSSKIVSISPSGFDLSECSSSTKDALGSRESGYASSRTSKTRSIRSFFKKGGSLLDIFKRSAKRNASSKCEESSINLEMVNAKKSADSQCTVGNGYSKTVLWFNCKKKKDVPDVHCGKTGIVKKQMRSCKDDPLTCKVGVACKSTHTPKCCGGKICTCMIDTQKQKDECKQYAQKVLLESAMRKEGYFKQYMDFKEIPLDILIGKAVTKSKHRSPKKESVAVEIQTSEHAQLKAMEESSKLTPKVSPWHLMKVGLDSPSEKSIKLIHKKVKKTSEDEGMSMDAKSKRLASSTNYESFEDMKLAKESISLEASSDSESHLKTHIEFSTSETKQLSMPRSSVSVTEKKLTDKEVFDKLLSKFDETQSIAERLSKDEDFFQEQMSVTTINNTDVGGKKKDDTSPTDGTPGAVDSSAKLRGPRFTDKPTPAGKNDCTVKADDIGTCFARGFRPDNMMLSGDACFNLNKQDKIKMSPHMLKNTESIIDFSERETPLDFLLALGFMVDEASNALKDDDIRSRLLAAITEARVWINKITTTQGTLLYLVAYKARPETMRYFLQLVEAIINKRITNAIKLDGFLRILEQVEDGRIQMITILGEDKFEDEENEEKIVKKQLKHLFMNVYTIAQAEALNDKKELDANQINLLRALVAKYRTGLHPHLELIARYIGQRLLDSDIQLEAAMIFLSRLDTADVKLKEFENYCGINCDIIQDKKKKGKSVRSS